MPDILIRDVSDDVLAAIDARATRLGISRVEYVRRRLAADVLTPEATVTAADLQRFCESVADLADPDIMRGAWE